MKNNGLNKRLYERRLELDYSVREACIRLDISKRKLFLIENGYIKVKDDVLKDRFIRKYNLDADFFEKDENLGYPTPLEEPEKVKKAEGKVGKFFRSWIFKVICGVLMIGFISMASTGAALTGQVTNDIDKFYSAEVRNTRDYVYEHGSQRSIVDSYTSTLLLDSYHALESGEYPTLDNLAPYVIEGYEGFVYNSLNFLDFKEYIGYTFMIGSQLVNSESILGFDLGPMLFNYETRIVSGKTRVHFNVYDPTGYVYENPMVHISVDVNKNYKDYTYNLVEVMNLAGEMELIQNTSYEYSLYTYLFEESFVEFLINSRIFFVEKYPELKITFDSFFEQQIEGLNNYTNYSSMISGMTLWGIILSVVFLALLVLSILKSFAWGLKISGEKESSLDKANEETVEEKEVRKLPKNRWPTPFVPEMIIRILVLVISFASSIGIFAIFQSLLDGNPLLAINSISFEAQIASFSMIAMMLLFFTKLDIRANKKNTFTINFILFFAGIVFYLVTLMIQNTMLSSKAFNQYASILNYLPGNIVWGILAFNLLSSILFSNPKFKNDATWKHVLYRLTALIPIGYMIVSTVYQIGKKAYGWTLPLEVSSLLFSKAFILTVFTVAYCLIVFLYKYITVKKFGKEQAEIYQNGNRYIFIKNFLVCLIILALGLTDYFVGKANPGNAFGFGTNYLMVFTIPFILLYRPHMGKRSKKWDLSFAALYGLSMVLGFLLIGSNLSVYIASL